VVADLRGGWEEKGAALGLGKSGKSWGNQADVGNTLGQPPGG
jgi:hypothetical protein